MLCGLSQQKGEQMSATPIPARDVSVLGLGAMGARMAQALVDAGKRVAVWNRTPEKSEALEAAGAVCFTTVEAALLASPIAILVLLDDQAVHDVLGSIDQARVLPGRTFVNFTTNSRDESAVLASLVSKAGGHYVKGVIIAYPRNIAHPESHAIYSGDADAVARFSDLLATIAPNSSVLPLDEAYALSAILHVFAFAAMTAYLEAVAASERFGMAKTKMARLVQKASGFFVSDAIEEAAKRLETDNFSGDQARLDVHASAFKYLAGAMHASGAPVPVFDAVCGAVQSAQSMGFGDQDIASMAKAYERGLRTNGPLQK